MGKKVEQMAAAQARRELQIALGKISDEQNKIAGFRAANDKPGAKDIEAKAFVDFCIERDKKLDEIFNNLNSVNNWLMALEEK